MWGIHVATRSTPLANRPEQRIAWVGLPTGEPFTSRLREMSPPRNGVSANFWGGGGSIPQFNLGSGKVEISDLEGDFFGVCPHIAEIPDDSLHLCGEAFLIESFV